MLAGSTTQVGMIRDLFLAGKSRREAVAALKPLVEAGTQPMVFTRNPKPGERGRQTLPMWEQFEALTKHVNRIYNELEREGYSPSPVPSPIVETPETPVIIDDGRLTPEIEEIIEESVEEIAPEIKPIAGSKRRSL